MVVCLSLFHYYEMQYQLVDFAAPIPGYYTEAITHASRQ